MKKTGHFVKALIIVAFFILPGVWAQDSRRTVTMWTFAPHTAEPLKDREAAIEQRFNINLEIEMIAQNVIVQKLQAEILTGGNPPDIIELYIENNIAMSIDPEKTLVRPLEEYSRNSSVFSSLPAGRTAWCTYGQHIYGLPRDVHPVVLVYNDTLWKSVGVDLAKIMTWDDFFLAARRLTAEKVDGQPLHYALPYGNDGLQNTMYMLWQQTGAEILDTSGKPQFTSPEFTAFIIKLREWVSSGAFSEWDWGQFDAMLANGTLASYPSPDWWISHVDMAAKEGRYQFRVRPLPVYKEGGPRTASWGGTFLAIPKSFSGKGSTNPLNNRLETAELYSIIEYMQYDVEDCKERLRKTGIIPANPAAWDDPSVQNPDPRFGGQMLTRLQCELAAEMPVIQNGDIFWDAINDFTEYYSLLELGKINLAECLQKAQEAAMQRLR